MNIEIESIYNTLTSKYNNVSLDDRDLSIGRKIKDAIINLVLTRAIGPNSGVATFININALPQRAPKNVNKNQYLISILIR